MNNLCAYAGDEGENHATHVERWLNPCKGYTVWTAPEMTCNLRWPSYGKPGCQTVVTKVY
ncbi:MAG: hypothetical protein BGO07_01445 [Alphaproteobacteria bacterium 40-19]|nr:MAG: hypothetical protein BGO07_01445 [Alphaproteobacteria bacterium 40-19]